MVSTGRGENMNFAGGIILLLAAIAMIFLARNGEERIPLFRRFWIVGQLYIMTAITMGVFGVAAIIVNWP
jgi:hypothetical protein